LGILVERRGGVKGLRFRLRRVLAVDARVLVA
jgi:hypothetical protein